MKNIIMFINLILLSSSAILVGYMLVGFWTLHRYEYFALTIALTLVIILALRQLIILHNND